MILFQPRLKPLDEILHIQVVSSRRADYGAVRALDHIIGLCGHAVLLEGDVGVDLAYGLESPAGIVRYPFRLGHRELVVGIESADNKFVPKKRKDPRVAPDTAFHLTAVDASVACEVDEKGLSGGFGGSFALGEVEISGKAERELQDIGILSRGR